MPEMPAMAGAARPVLLDAEEVTLSDGDGAWVPAVLVKPAPGPGPWQLRPNALSRVEAVVGEWDGERGMLLIMNVLQPEVTLRRGDLVAAALAAEAPGEAPSHAHILVDEPELEKVYLEELPPETQLVDVDPTRINATDEHIRTGVQIQRTQLTGQTSTLER